MKPNRIVQMSSIRLWHGYIGILIAPSVIFFALTGALQIFNLHESHDGYTPPMLIEKLSSMHKDQVFQQKQHDEPGPEPQSGQPPPAEHEEGPALGTTLLKWFFLFVALSLTTSTALGLWIGLTRLHRKPIGWYLLTAGIVLPIGLYVL